MLDQHLWWLCSSKHALSHTCFLKFNFQLAKVCWYVISLHFSSRIFLLGPSHHYYTPKCALSKATVYKTPIGDLPIDLEGTISTHESELHWWMHSRFCLYFPFFVYLLLILFIFVLGLAIYSLLYFLKENIARLFLWVMNVVCLCNMHSSMDHKNKGTRILVKYTYTYSYVYPFVYLGGKIWMPEWWKRNSQVPWSGWI